MAPRWTRSARIQKGGPGEARRFELSGEAQRFAIGFPNVRNLSSLRTGSQYRSTPMSCWRMWHSSNARRHS